MKEDKHTVVLERRMSLLLSLSTLKLGNNECFDWLDVCLWGATLKKNWPGLYQLQFPLVKLSCWSGSLHWLTIGMKKYVFVQFICVQGSLLSIVIRPIKSCTDSVYIFKSCSWLQHFYVFIYLFLSFFYLCASCFISLWVLKCLEIYSFIKTLKVELFCFTL